MSQYDNLIASLRSEPYAARKQLLEYTLRILENERKAMAPEDKTALLTYAYEEVDSLLKTIPAAENYRQKDLLFTVEDLLLGLIMYLCPDHTQIPQDIDAKLHTLVNMVTLERYIERKVDALFSQDTLREVVEEPAITDLLQSVCKTNDEYQRGMLYNGLNHYRGAISQFTDGAKKRMGAHIAAEFRRYLSQDPLDEDCVNNLEVASDLCKYFLDEELIDLLKQILHLGYSNVNFYVVETLLAAGVEVPPDAIDALARNLPYADLTYSALKHYGKESLFPREYAAPEYLAKSDMVHWLIYPTELGKEPDEIVYVGKISYLFKKECYYVFKFRSDSDTLGDDLKNKWLLGWSSQDGFTFSNFDLYSDYEKTTVEATLRNIKKKCIG